MLHAGSLGFHISSDFISCHRLQDVVHSGVPSAYPIPALASLDTITGVCPKRPEQLLHKRTRRTGSTESLDSNFCHHRARSENASTRDERKPVVGTECWRVPISEHPSHQAKQRSDQPQHSCEHEVYQQGSSCSSYKPNL